MEIKIKVGDQKVKLSDADLIKKLKRGENPLETILPKSNFDFFAKFYESLPQNMITYYKELSKAFGKQLDISEPGIGKIPDSPDVFPANGHDIFNYIARYGTANFTLQAVMKLEGRLDYTKLEKAVRLSVDAEPVLGCRFVEGNPPYWKRRENIDKVQFCSFEEVTNPKEAVQRLLDSPLNMDNDPMIKVRLMRSKVHDFMVIQANHVCLDGAGIKEYIELLSNIYSTIDRPNGVFTPTPGTRGRIDQDRLLETLGITDPNALWIPGSDYTIPTWAFPWKQGTSNSTHIIIRRFPADQLDKMSRYAKSRVATINDLLLTAYYRAMLGMGQPVYGVPMGMAVTVDLRRYLPNNKTEAIRNFSGSVNTWLSMVENEPFSDTLAKVVYAMNEIKKGYPGLQSAIGLERLEKISFKDTLAYYQATSKVGKEVTNCSAYDGNRCVPTLSNLGILFKDLIKFGRIVVSDVFICTPVVSAPGLLLEVGTYNGRITMTAGYYENTVLREDVERLLDNFINQLLQCCR